MKLTPRSQSALAGGVAALICTCSPGAVHAEADGPDYWVVRGVASNDALNIRREPSASAKIVGTIPYNARSLRNIGCQGVPTFSEWSKMTASERKSASARRWCQIEYKGTRGWVSGKFLAE